MSEVIGKFEQAVKNRANQRVQERIELFRLKIADALGDLLPGSLKGTYGLQLIRAGASLSDNHTGYALIKECLERILSESPRQEWPSVLWETEEAAVTKELMNLLDPVQRAFKAPEPGPDDCSPAPIKNAGA